MLSRLKYIIFFLAIVSQAQAAKTDAPTKSKVGKTSSRSPAKASIPCVSMPWLQSRDLSIRQLKFEFDRMPREQLVQTAWFELEKGKKNSVAMPLLHYLASTSRKATESQYFQALGYIASSDYLPSEAIKRWPDRVPMKPLPMSVKEMCRLHTKST